MTEKRVLVAYYSYSGNTKVMAEKIRSKIGGDIFEIMPVKKYPNNYNDVVNIAQKEKSEGYKPELLNNIDISNYDIIFIGTPVWWYTFSSPIRTFLADNDFQDKTIIPFCTHGGGGASATYTDMQELAPEALVKEGFAAYENSATDIDIQAWLNRVIN